MNALSNEQKRRLAKMLPKVVHWDEFKRVLLWAPHARSSISRVRETEELHLVSLVEAKLDEEQWIQYTYAILDLTGFKTRTMNAVGVYGGIALLKATTPQRCTALMEVMK